jgi:hypothetical protein
VTIKVPHRVRAALRFVVMRMTACARIVARIIELPKRRVSLGNEGARLGSFCGCIRALRRLRQQAQRCRLRPDDEQQKGPSSSPGAYGAAGLRPGREATGHGQAAQRTDRPVHLGFKVTEQLNADLRPFAKKRGSPMSDVVVEILERGLRDAAKRRRSRILRHSAMSMTL